MEVKENVFPVIKGKDQIADLTQNCVFLDGINLPPLVDGDIPNDVIPRQKLSIMALLLLTQNTNGNDTYSLSQNVAIPILILLFFRLLFALWDKSAVALCVLHLAISTHRRVLTSWSSAITSFLLLFTIATSIHVLLHPIIARNSQFLFSVGKAFLSTYTLNVFKLSCYGDTYTFFFAYAL